MTLSKYKIKATKFDRGGGFHMMRRKVMYLILVFAFIIFLSGCNTIFSPEIYVSDLLALKNEEDDIVYISSILKLEVISKESYTENKDKITKILQKYFGEISKVSYKSENFKSFYEAELEVLSRKSLNRNPLEGGIFGFRVREDNSSIVLAISFNARLFKQLKDEIFNEFYQTVNTDDLEIKITLINDLRNNVKIVTQGVYLGGHPCPFGVSYTLKRREKIDIIFSNVLRDYLVNSEEVEFLSIISE